MRTFALAVTLAVLAAPAADAAKGVRGRLRGGKGYVIVGTSVSGEGVSQTLGASEKFALRFPGTSGRDATLQLLTPAGRYFVASRFVPYHDTFLGVFAEETSAYSKLTEWPGGGVVGIHGTSLPQLLGQAVSHGCVRVANSTARHLKSLAPLGTPIWIKK